MAEIKRPVKAYYAASQGEQAWWSITDAEHREVATCTDGPATAVIVDALNGARDAEIRAEEREACELAVLREVGSDKRNQAAVHACAAAIRARAQPAERAKEAGECQHDWIGGVSTAPSHWPNPVHCSKCGLTVMQP